MRRLGPIEEKKMIELAQASRELRFGDSILQVTYTTVLKRLDKIEKLQLWTSNIDNSELKRAFDKVEHFQTHCGEEGRKRACSAPKRRGTGVVRAPYGWKAFQPGFGGKVVHTRGADSEVDTLCFYDLDGPHDETGWKLRELTDSEKQHGFDVLVDYLKDEGCVFRTAGGSPKAALWVRNFQDVDFHRLLREIHEGAFGGDPIYAPGLREQDYKTSHLTREAIEELYLYSQRTQTPYAVGLSVIELERCYQEMWKRVEEQTKALGVMKDIDTTNKNIPSLKGLGGVLESQYVGAHTGIYIPSLKGLERGLESQHVGAHTDNKNIPSLKDLGGGLDPTPTPTLFDQDSDDIDWDGLAIVDGPVESDEEINARLLQHGLRYPIYDGPIPRSCFGRKVSKRATVLFQLFVSLYETAYAYEDDETGLGVALPAVLVEQQACLLHPDTYPVRKELKNKSWTLDCSGARQLIAEAVKRGVIACSSENRYTVEHEVVDTETGEVRREKISSSYVPGRLAKSYIPVDPELIALIQSRISEKRSQPREERHCETRPQTTIEGVDRLHKRLTGSSLEETVIEDGNSNWPLYRLCFLCATFEVYREAALMIPGVSSREDRVASLPHKWRAHLRYLDREK